LHHALLDRLVKVDVIDVEIVDLAPVLMTSFQPRLFCLQFLAVWRVCFDVHGAKSAVLDCIICNSNGAVRLFAPDRLRFCQFAAQSDGKMSVCALLTKIVCKTQVSLKFLPGGCRDKVCLRQVTLVCDDVLFTIY
jgi:hypothetical protein